MGTLGGIGEIFIRAAYIPDFTYNKLNEKRAEVARGELVSVGDVGYIDADGFVYLCDRKRDMVISGGVNIYPAEIERSEEHTSELQSLMRISYAVFCLKKSK